MPGPDEVVVAVRACGLNRLDLLQREAPLVRGFSLPHVAGMDVAGVVVARGSGVGDEWPADRRPGARRSGEHVRRLRAVHRRARAVLREPAHHRFDPPRRLRRARGDAGRIGVTRSPTATSFVEAACLPVAYMTAWHALFTVGRVRPGETVLVNAAGSGVSTAIVQFAVAAGATVIGTAGGAEKVGQALDLGCAHAIDHHASTRAATSPPRCSSSRTAAASIS